MTPFESLKVAPQFTEEKREKTRYINKSVLSVEMSLLTVYYIISSNQEKMCYHENPLLKYFISSLSICISSCAEGTRNMSD